MDELSGYPRTVTFDGVRLHVVSGKGGTGKTTVAASLALALAAGGRRVLLTEVEGRQGIAQLFDTPPLPYEERKIAVAPDGGDVYALAIDPEDALLDYLDMFYNLKPNGMAARTLRRMGAVEFATTIAPGMRDVLLTGKVKEAVTRKAKNGRPAYDAVVLDAPPTGRIARFLNISSEVSGLAKVGPIRTQADSVMATLRSPQTAVHLVTLLEEMPVQETIDGIGELEASALPSGAVFVNMVRAPLLPEAALTAAAKGDVDRTELVRGVKTAGLDLPETVVEGLAAEAVEHAQRVQLERQERAELAALDKPLFELPLLPDAIDLSCLYELAGALREQGVAGKQ